MKMLILKRSVLLGKRLAVGMAVLLAGFYPYAVAAAAPEGSSLLVRPARGSDAKPMLRAFTIELSSKGFNGGGQLTLEVNEGDEVELTFIFVDDLATPTAHQITIPDYGVDTGLLNRERPRSTVRFTASKAGKFAIVCLYPCTGHQNMQGAQLIAKAQQTVEATARGLSLAAPERAVAGMPVRLVATLRNEAGAPMLSAPVTFAQKSDFFVTDGLLALGEATTDNQGVAVLEYTPHGEGNVVVVARYEGSSAPGPVRVDLSLTVAPGREGYRPQAGIRPIVEVPVGGELSVAVFAFPISASWGLALLLTGLWSTYLVVAYQVLQIEATSPLPGMVARRLLPTFMLGFVVVVASTLVWIVLTSPYVHHHLGPPPVPWPVMADLH